MSNVIDFYQYKHAREKEAEYFDRANDNIRFEYKLKERPFPKRGRKKKIDEDSSS